MMLVAEVGDLQGNAEAARRGFIEAARSTAELLHREPNNWQRVYDHAQSEFWLAYDAHNRGDSQAALPHFVAYRDLGRRMMEIAPKKTESQVELASAEINLGVALVGERKLNEAIASFDRASAMFGGIRPRTRDVGLNSRRSPVGRWRETTAKSRRPPPSCSVRSEPPVSLPATSAQDLKHWGKPS